MSSAPPPYRSNTSNSEVRIDAGVAPFHLRSGDITGLRAQILDNAPSLFSLAHGSHVRPPDNFRINTLRIPDGPDAGQVGAYVVLPQDGRAMVVLELFVQGPLADTTEGALRGLLERIEGMMGRVWEIGAVSRQQMFIRSIDE